MNEQGMFVAAPAPKHPAVALTALHRSPHLIGQGRKGDLLIGRGQRATDRAIGPIVRDRVVKGRDRRLEPALHQVDETAKRDVARGTERRVVLDLVTVEGMEKQRGANALVEVLS